MKTPVYPPVGRVGAIYLLTTAADRASNRMVGMIDPYASEAERAQGVCRDGHEYFRQHVDPVVSWLESTKTPTSALLQFDRVGGNPDDFRRYWQPDEWLVACERKPWLVDGMLESAACLADGGRQVVCHLGGPDSAAWADTLLHRHGWRGLWRRIEAVYGPIADAGAWVGLDGASGERAGSASDLIAQWFRYCGVPFQIESTPEYKYTHWRDTSQYIVWPLYVQRHVKQEPWAVGKWAAVGTKEYARAHADVRVALWSFDFPQPVRLWGDAQQQRAILGEMAATSRELIAQGVRVLLDSKACQVAAKLKIPVSEFGG